MKFVPVSVTRAIGKVVVTTKKNQPHIFFVGGVIGAVSSTVLACRATLQLEPVVDDIKTDLEKTQSLKSLIDVPEYNKLITRTYLRSGVKIGRLYAPAAILGGVSIAALTSSHVQLTRRNATLTAAYAGLSEVFDNYRERVKAELGEEKERDIYFDVKEETIDEDGKKVKVKVAEGLPNQFARFFDRNNKNWEPSPGWNRNFLQAQQNYANDKLRVDGYVFLNDVYSWLGFERTSVGQLVGWTVNSEEGDGYISYGLDDAFNVRRQSSVEWTCILDFNVEGIVYDKI